MASIKISNLPALSSGTLTDDDQFVINDANQTTSRLSYGDFKTAFLATNLTFAGSVNFSGDITITESVTSNVYTKDEVVFLVAAENTRALAAESALETQITNVTNGVAVLAAAENTFAGNLNVIGVLSQQGSGVLTTANTTDVVRTGSLSTTMDGDFNVKGTLSKEGSAVATVSDLAGLGTGQQIQDAQTDATQALTNASIADGKAVAAQGTADSVQSKLAGLDTIAVDSADIASLEAKVASLVLALKAAL